MYRGMNRETLRSVTARILISARGAIDLASILVGVLVLGVLGGVIAAAVLVVVPWAQNAAANADLSAVKDAESIALVKDGGYLSYADLVVGKKIGEKASIAVGTSTARDCYVGASRSGTGTFYVIDDKMRAAVKYTAGMTSSCLDLVALINSIPGAGVVAVVNPLEVCRTPVDGAAVNVSTPAQLTAAFAAGGSVKLTANVSMASLAVGASKTVVLDLNGFNLTLSSSSTAAIRVPVNSAFTLNNNNVAGELSATATSTNAAIGGESSVPAGRITINCGTVTATTNGTAYAAAIGSGYSSSFQSVDIAGGVVVARSGTATSTRGGAAIGGGDYGTASGAVTITGGTVDARSAISAARDIGMGTSSSVVAASITGGFVNGAQFPATAGVITFMVSDVSSVAKAFRSASQLPGFTRAVVKLDADIPSTSAGYVVLAGPAVTLDLNGNALTVVTTTAAAIRVAADATFTVDDSRTGGKLTATATQTSAAIGGEGTTAAGRIVIAGGTVIATTNGTAYAAAIGAGISSSFQSIDITGGSVTARSGSASTSRGGAAIGGGDYGTASGAVTITGGTVDARSAISAAQDIGAGTNSSAVTVTITGGLVNGVQR